MQFSEFRAGAYLHGEYSPADWITLTGGLRLDYNTETGAFLSPRLAVVIQTADSQFLRLGVTRAFRKPNFWEKRIHCSVEFPETGPFTNTSSQDSFREFMTRVAGNEQVDNEKITAFRSGLFYTSPRPAPEPLAGPVLQLVPR